MVRGRGGQPTRGRGVQNMGTRSGRIDKGGRTNINPNMDFGFSSQTKSSYGGLKQNHGGYNNNPNNNYSSNNNQQQQHSNANNYNRFGGNSNTNNRFSGNNAPNNNQMGNNTNNQNRGNNQRQNRNQGQNQNFGGSNGNTSFNKNQGQNQNYGGSNGNNPSYNRNQGYKQNQNSGYNKQNTSYNNSASQFNQNSNSYPQRNQNNAFSDNSNAGFNNDDFGPAKPSLLGNHPAISAPPARNEPSSDDILKEIGKVFLTSMTGAGSTPSVNPMVQQKMMSLMQGNQSGGPPNPSPYDNFYNNGNQYTNFNPPMFQNYRGGYNPRGRDVSRGGMNNRGVMNNRGGMINRGGMNNRGGIYNRGGNVGGQRMNATRGKTITPNKRIPGTPNAGVKKQPFKAKNNTNNANNNKGSKNVRSLTFKSLKYCLHQLHKNVDESAHPLAAFLRQAFYELSSDNKTHFLMLSRIILKHENVVKLVSYEVKKCLDKKFGDGTDEDVIKKKIDFLKEKKTKFFDDYKAACEGQENLAEKEKIIDDALPILAGQNFTDDHIPKPEDYITDAALKEHDYILNFQLAFFNSCYEKFMYRLNHVSMPSKSLTKRVKFELDNAFLSHLIVDQVKLKSNAKLPAVLAKYATPIKHSQAKSKIDTATKCTLDVMTKNNELIETNIADYIANEKVSAEVLRNFADCIILFDKIASSVKFKLLNYTPYINLNPDLKRSTFDELVKSIYKGVLDILKNNIKTSEKKFVDMEKDEVVEGEESKDIVAALIEDEDVETVATEDLTADVKTDSAE